MLIVCGVESHAQYDNVWAFGDKAGIDFNSQPPRPITTAINTTEGCASICDTNGRLLFYTDGSSVWNRNNDTMLNGRNLPGQLINITASTSQGAVIVPMPGSKVKYYVFSLGGFITDTSVLGLLYYSIVDMSLNNGLGDVESGSKGIPLDSFLTEHMSAVSGNDCDIWLLVVSRTDNAFKAYHITTNGIDVRPVFSPGLAPKKLLYYRDYAGNMEFSPDRNKLAIAQDKLILYDFNPDNGTVNRPIVLDTFYISPVVAPFYVFGVYYGLTFSRDNSKLYTGIHTVPGVWQFDLSSGDSLTMAHTKTQVAREEVYAIKRGPDGKVYCGISNSSKLSVIHQPNLAGSACQYETADFSLASGTRLIFGLPNYAAIATRRQVYRSRSDTAFCVPNFLLAAHHSSGMNYQWDDGSSGATRQIDKSGTYWVSYQVNSPCMFDECVDTFKVVFDYSTQYINTTVQSSGECTSDTLLLDAISQGGSGHIWEDGSTALPRAVNKTGIYWLRYQTDSLCAMYTDSFFISYPEKDPEVSFDADPFVCTGDTVRFENTSSLKFNNLLWLFGDQHESSLDRPEHSYSQAGTYDVRLTGKIDGICPDTAYQTIVVDPIFFNSFIKNRDSICMGEHITFSPLANSHTISNIRWQFGNDHELNTKENNALQHAYDLSGIMPVRLSTQYRACPESAFTDTIYVSPLPLVSLGTDTGLCFNGSAVTLKNLLSGGQTTRSFSWNTGDTSESIPVTHPGIYSLTVSHKLSGCSNTATIEIKKDCYLDIPNAFTPNADGINDYFFPRQLLSRGIDKFRMQVFNRWGQVIFASTEIDGQGWDGNFNGVKQPEGIYIYLISVEIKGSPHQQYQGDVTLLR